MADSTAKERKKNVTARGDAGGGATMFSMALRAIHKDKHKNLASNSPQQFKCESDSQNLNSSKRTSNELPTVDEKNSVFECHVNTKDDIDSERFRDKKSNFQKNDSHVDASSPKSFKHNPNSKQALNMSQNHSQKPYSKETNNQNNFNSHQYHDSHKDNVSKYDQQNSEHNVKFRKLDSQNLINSKKTFDELSIDRKNSEEYHVNRKYDHDTERSYDKKSNFLKNDSHVDASYTKSLHNSNFKQVSNISSNNSKKNYSYKNNKQNNFNSHQHRDSYKDSFNKYPPKYDFNSESKFKFQDDIKSDYKSKDPSTKVQDKEEENFSDDPVNFENDFVDEASEVKYQRSCSQLNETLKDEKKNIRVTLKLAIPKSVPNASPDPNSVSMPPVSSALSASTFSESNTSASLISDISPLPFLSSPSPFSSSESHLEINSNLFSNLVISNELDDFSLTNKSILNSSDNDFIPPPVSCELSNPSDNMYSTTERNGTILQNSGSETTEVCSYGDEDVFSLPDSEHLQAISNFIEKVVKERSVSNSVADKVVADLNRLFKNNFEGNVIDYYGSYQTDLAITTSDINLMIIAKVSIKKSFMFEIHRLLHEELQRYHVHQYEEGTTAHKSKINFTHPDTGISCELAYLGKNKNNHFLDMGRFLVRMCRTDSRVKPLIIAAKVWAEHLNINEVEDGKLHPIGFTLLVIHFLQHCENPILPIYSHDQKDKESLPSLPDNNSSIGALWLQFLWYYSFTFNWHENILTITSADKVSKKSKNWENYWIAIEDPFTSKNIAESVINKDVADYIKSCFKGSYSYFWNGPEIIPSFDDKENQGISESSGVQLEFSFNDCIVEQKEDICEMCYEIDDVCDECKKKKIYVQPMTSVPKMTDDFLKVVKEALLTVYSKYILTDEEVNERRCFVKELEKDVRKLYPDAHMSLFGSSANGFGFKKSDLDICLTFKSKEELKAFSVLRDLRYLLRKNKDFVNVIAIFNAQIPILKFRYEPRGWHGDISLYNVLAVHNSKLLYMYSLIDERCKILGCALKLIAKKALIAEVTEKALSSYSYIIMVIHFLQQTNPPVLPILQDNQFRRGDFDLHDIIDDCNVWFCHDISYIKKVFKTENDTPVEQLFLDLLDYYCSFDCDQVITIRQREILPLSEKMRSARLFNIQDPFLVTKNLGCVVSPTKAQETKSVLNRARQLFRTPSKELSTDLEKYFFSTMNLTGSYKEDSLCDLCGKFGHDQKDCRQCLFPFPKRNFKYFPRKMQYTNQNGIFKQRQINKKPFYRKVSNGWL